MVSLAKIQNNMDELILDAKSTDPNDKGCRSIVRVKTSVWHDRQGVHYKRDLIKMKRLSWDFQILEEDCSNIGTDHVIERIVNLFEVDDGLYEVITCNPSADWETGYIDDYDYKLAPFDKNKNVTNQR